MVVMVMAPAWAAGSFVYSTTAEKRQFGVFVGHGRMGLLARRFRCWPVGLGIEGFAGELCNSGAPLHQASKFVRAGVAKPTCDGAGTTACATIQFILDVGACTFCMNQVDCVQELGTAWSWVAKPNEWR